MNHQEAVGLQAAQKYFLGELSPSEREQFEEHFFDCVECAEDVRAGAVFIANTRAVFAEDDRRAVARDSERATRAFFWTRPVFAAAACLCAIVLLGLAAYQNLVSIPHLRRENSRLAAPRSYPAFFLRPVSRGDDQVIQISSSDPFLGFSVDVPPDRPFPAYICEFVDASGERKFSVSVPPPASPGLPLNILVPGGLPPGRYTLALRGHEGKSPDIELNRHQFMIQLK